MCCKSKIRYAIFLISGLTFLLPLTLVAGHKYEERIVKKRPCESGEEIFVRNELGSITVDTWNKDEIWIEAVKKVRHESDREEARELLDKIEIKIEETEKGIRIKTVFPEMRDYKYKGSWSRLIKNLFNFPPRVESESLPLEVSYKLKLPSDVKLHLDTEIGDILVRDLKGSVDARSEIGEIKLAEISGQIKAETEVGEIIIDRPGGPVKASSEIGKITVGVDKKMSARLNVQTELGKIEIDADIRLEGNVSRKRVKGTIGNGGELIDLQTEIGKIRITSWDELISYFCEDNGDDKNSMENDCLTERKKRAKDVFQKSITFAAMLSQKRDKFSKWDPLLGFEANTMWRRTDKSRMHSFFDLSLTRVPQILEIRSNGGSIEESFKIARRTLKSEIGWYWVRDICLDGEDVLSLGPTVGFGLESFALHKEMAADGSIMEIRAKNNFYSAGGMRFSQHKKSRYVENPEIIRSLELLVARNSRYLLRGSPDTGITETESRSRFIMDAYSKWLGDLYVGFRADFPLDFNTMDVEGDPDLRMWLGFRW